MSPSFDPERTAEKVYTEIDDCVGLYDGCYAHLGYKYAILAYMDGRGEILAKRRETWLTPGVNAEYSMYKRW